MNIKDLVPVFIIIILFLSTSGTGHTKVRINSEKFYQESYCQGQVEIPLKDHIKGKRAVHCDCLSETHAIEFDFADKWAEAIGQSLYYAYLTGKKAGIYLIIERQEDLGYLERLKGAINKGNLDIDIWIITPNGEINR
jgi:hypothetical protein